MSEATGKPFRMITIVGVEHTYEVAIFGQLEASGEGCMSSLIFLDHQMNPRISDGANDRYGIIPGAIVYDHQSLRWNGLSENRVDRFSDIRSVIVRRNDAGNFLAHS